MKLATDLPGLLNRIDHPSAEIRIVARMRLRDYASDLQRWASTSSATALSLSKGAQGPPQHRGHAGFVGLSVGRDD